MRFIALLVSLFLTSPASAQLSQLGRLDPKTSQGVQEMSKGKSVEAIATLSAVVQSNPDDYVAWYFLGLTQHGQGQLDEAMKSHLLAASLIPKQNPLIQNALYNVACVHALQGRPERALQYLHRARNEGYSNGKYLMQDTDLTVLREDPRFVAMANRSFLGKEKVSTQVSSITEAISGQTGGVAVGPDGIIYVADFANQVWKVSPDGSMEVLATGFTKAAGCALDADGNLYQADHGQNKIWKISADGTKTDLNAQGLRGPVGVAYQADGNLLVTSYQGQSIMRVAQDGSSEILSEGGLLSGPNGIALASDGRVFVVNYNDGVVLQILEDGTQKLITVLPGRGNGHLAWLDGAMFVTARRANQIYHVTPLGEVSLVAGGGKQGVEDGGPIEARFGLPNGIAMSPDGKYIYVNDRTNKPTPEWVLRRISIAQPDAKLTQ